MAACNFSIPLNGTAQQVLDKARAAVQSQGGVFEGDEQQGSFEMSVFGSALKGSYSVADTNMNIVIDSKPFLIPCSTIEGFLKAQLSS